MTAALPGSPPLGWFAIARLGLVQAAIGAVVVLATSTLNRVMVVELALPAVVPGALVALHYLVQVLRPRFGHGADLGRRRAPWIRGGIVTLAAGGVLAAAAVALASHAPIAGIALAVPAYALVGLGVGAAGTSLLALLAARVTPERRAAAAAMVWIMMIAGIAITAGMAGAWLNPFSTARLLGVTATVSLAAIALAWAALGRIETSTGTGAEPASRGHEPFRAALAALWRDRQARAFTLFVLLSMIAYSAQELVLEPFAGAVFALPPGATTQLTGLQHGGVLAGMLLVAIAGTRFVNMRLWTMGGCLASSAMLLVLALSPLAGAGFPLRTAIFSLGIANGTFAVSAIGAMMALAGRQGGLRIGLFGGAQAIGFALGGLIGTGASDLARLLLGDPRHGYALLFALEAGLFAVAAFQASGVFAPSPRRVNQQARALA